MTLKKSQRKNTIFSIQSGIEYFNIYSYSRSGFIKQKLHIQQKRINTPAR